MSDRDINKNFFIKKVRKLVVHVAPLGSFDGLRTHSIWKSWSGKELGSGNSRFAWIKGGKSIKFKVVVVHDRSGVHQNADTLDTTYLPF